MNAPRRKAADPVVAELAVQIAQRLYPTFENPLGSIIKYEKDIVKLRKLVIHQRKRYIENMTRQNDLMSWDKRIIAQGPWDPIADPLSLDGAPSLPMPIQIAEHETFEPFFEHLRLGGTEEMTSTKRAANDAIEAEEPYYGTKTLEFEKGVVYSDGRMDLCKTEVGPTNIGDLIESLKTNTFIKHFLLGNNIIGPHGAKCIAEFVKEFPERMDTWYLAGNCIDADSFALLVDAWVKSPAVTNIWLKRNPLKAVAANDVFRLITETPNLRTLDLDQTNLGDEGVAVLFSKLAQHHKPLPLRHIYLNAIGISLAGATSIASYLASPHCTLTSLYASNNPLGNPGATALARGLAHNTSLTRLLLSSTGLTSPGTTALCNTLSTHPALTTLDLSQSYATQDLASRYNYLTDACAPAIRTLISSSPHLAYLNLGYCALSHAGLNDVLRAVLTSQTLLYYTAKSIHPQSRSAPHVAAGQTHAVLSKQAQEQLCGNVRGRYGDMGYDAFLRGEKRWLVSERAGVRKIDSVYRNRQAGVARRGGERLEKGWGEGEGLVEDVL
ncbi:RNI-like protein, partial [Polyplosphaeria fusca]